MAIAFCAGMLATAAGAAAPIAWRNSWSDGLFEQAAKEHRFVLLDLHAVWCHWCHVMDETTYADPDVQRLVGQNYVAVSVDADSDPDLTSRYGDWGWPATIVLAADGTEIVKRRGYLPPQQMASLLQAIIDDPSPGPSVTEPTALAKSDAFLLTAPQRAALKRSYDTMYDKRNGGWGSVHKLIDAQALELAYVNADSPVAPLKSAGSRRARTTLDNNLLLMDPIWGGVYQYSDARNWRSPHFEKLLSYQADDLRLYAEAYCRWHESRYLAAANSLFGYIESFLQAPDGGFFVSQDADVSAEVSGRNFYTRDDAQRRKLGMPKVDTHEYARETGWAIRALAKYYDVTGNEQALRSAERGARWALANRRLTDNAFRHDQQDRGGPFLDDNLSMSEAVLGSISFHGRSQLAWRCRRHIGFHRRNISSCRGRLHRRADLKCDTGCVQRAGASGGPERSPGPGRQHGKPLHGRPALSRIGAPWHEVFNCGCGRERRCVPAGYSAGGSRAVEGADSHCHCRREDGSCRQDVARCGA